MIHTICSQKVSRLGLWRSWRNDVSQATSTSHVSVREAAFAPLYREIPDGYGPKVIYTFTERLHPRSIQYYLSPAAHTAGHTTKGYMLRHNHEVHGLTHLTEVGSISSPSSQAQISHRPATQPDDATPGSDVQSTPPSSIHAPHCHGSDYSENVPT